MSGIPSVARVVVMAMIMVCVLLGSTSSRALAKEEVRLHVLVIEASKSLKSFDSRVLGAVRKHLEDVGHTGARVLDELNASAEEIGARVQLEILARGGDPKHLRVTVLSASSAEIRLRVEIPEFKFDTSTRQKPATTVALAFRTPTNEVLYLSVTPSL